VLTEKKATSTLVSSAESYSTDLLLLEAKTNDGQQKGLPMGTFRTAETSHKYYQHGSSYERFLLHLRTNVYVQSKMACIQKKECKTKTPIPGGMCYFLCFQIVMLREKGTLSYTKNQRLIKDIKQY
jgi:hypothetical protein